MGGKQQTVIDAPVIDAATARKAAVNVVATGIEEGWTRAQMRMVLAALGLTAAREYTPGICHNDGCNNELSAAASTKIPHGYCSITCHREHIRAVA
jgi:hypothetical protein